MTIIDNALDVFRDTFLSGDMATIAISLTAVGIASMRMQHHRQIIPMTLLALFLHAGGGTLLGAFTNGTPSIGILISHAKSSWHTLNGMTVGDSLAYFIAFMTCVAFLFTARSLMKR